MGKIKEEERIRVWEKFDQRCAYCGCVLEYNKMQVDHIDPLFRGTTQIELDRYNIKKGTNNFDNYNPSCPSCNSSKSTFTLEKWRKQLEFKKKRIVRDSSSFRILQRFGIVKFTTNKVTFYFERRSNNG